MLSTTIQQSLDQFTSDADTDVNPAKVHERYLWTNPEVCNECYSRVKRIEEFERDDWGNMDTYSERAGAGVLGYDDDDTGIYKPRTFCEECGSRGCAHPETDSKRDAVRRATRIAERLKEQGIPVDAVALRRAARKLKGHDELQGLDREIYERATKIAVRRALP